MICLKYEPSLVPLVVTFQSENSFSFFFQGNFLKLFLYLLPFIFFSSVFIGLSLFGCQNSWNYVLMVLQFHFCYPFAFFFSTLLKIFLILYSMTVYVHSLDFIYLPRFSFIDDNFNFQDFKKFLVQYIFFFFFF